MAGTTGSSLSRILKCELLLYGFRAGKECVDGLGGGLVMLREGRLGGGVVVQRLRVIDRALLRLGDTSSRGGCIATTEFPLATGAVIHSRLSPRFRAD